MPASTLSASIHEVRLRNVPKGFAVPDNLQNLLRYEPDRQVLVYDGFMSAAAYAQLTDLSKDADYRKALDDLFRIAVPETSSSEVSFARWAACLALAICAGVLAAVTFSR